MSEPTADQTAPAASEWHRYPETIPLVDGYYLTWCAGHNDLGTHSHFLWWSHTLRWVSVEKEIVTHWASVRPPEVK